MNYTIVEFDPCTMVVTHTYDMQALDDHWAKIALEKCVEHDGTKGHSYMLRDSDGFHVATLDYV